MELGKELWGEVEGARYSAKLRCMKRAMLAGELRGPGQGQLSHSGSREGRTSKKPQLQLDLARGELHYNGLTRSGQGGTALQWPNYIWLGGTALQWPN